LRALTMVVRAALPRRGGQGVHAPRVNWCPQKILHGAKTMRMAMIVAAALGLAACEMQPVEESPGAAPRSMVVEGKAQAPEPNHPVGNDTYTVEEIVHDANAFFGESSEGIAAAIERAFSEYGRPNAYIIGQEGSGAAIVGLRYGAGTLTYKGGGGQRIYWQGPSIGWDFGGNASKVFTLVYNLRSTYDLLQRFPAVEGSLYIFAGVGLNYQRSGDITLAPIRTGVGLRAGASLGYVHYTQRSSVVPF
jgi:hypothetical protein